ncbi:dihydrolipoamide dehydrogenase [Owenweeksia hongkongensis DSM 17368]|uniref:Dihydrolipoyl dehydrogenase n=1 Tax=Owenweeksia hongkongensis (strain DSM 17368 / CIP 108786 / JCM 12287 / NRRL B-23963 / UST20020801) TaxID=926562 RepID=G8R162_OWEHD|nr:dihydrolipoyl dehydrogenase [Owenweeksia hongkongensis]AEV32777.1 dihydrolipoamide dehydrogenase [Owenweeksia hongkongensis DSM 17368]
MTQYDVAVIGSGPGGYVAAIRCAQLGFKTAIIEKYSTLGGTCLNVGCIPSKALLDSSEHFHNALKNFDTHGIKINTPEVDFTQMVDRKQKVVDQTCDGVKFLMGKNKIEVYEGLGSFIDENTINIAQKDGDEKIGAKHIIIATGSKPTELPFAKFDKERIISSTEALKLKEVPKTMVVIGGGVIGLELGSVYARLGTEVTVVEYMDKIIPTMDAQLGKELMKSLKKLGMKFNVSHKVTDVKREGDTVTVSAEDKKGKAVSFEAEYCLVSVGRRPYTDGLNLDKAGLTTDDRGRIETNEHLQTAKSHIYAIGDVVKGAMLAHKASEEGTLVAETIAGQKPHIDYNLIPGVVYTWPEVASVGKSEEQLKKEGKEVKSGSFPFKALGRARASMDLEGMVKILADKETDEILGVHMIGPRAADLIAEAVVAMEYRASADDISRMSHAHPTFAEAIKEAALAATDNRPLHI